MIYNYAAGFIFFEKPELCNLKRNSSFSFSLFLLSPIEILFFKEFKESKYLYLSPELIVFIAFLNSLNFLLNSSLFSIIFICFKILSHSSLDNLQKNLVLVVNKLSNNLSELLKSSLIENPSLIIYLLLKYFSGKSLFISSLIISILFLLKGIKFSENFSKSSYDNIFFIGILLIK